MAGQWGAVVSTYKRGQRKENQWTIDKVVVAESSLRYCNVNRLVLGVGTYNASQLAASGVAYLQNGLLSSHRDLVSTA